MNPRVGKYLPVIPSSQRRSGEHHFSNADALSFSARNTADEVIAYFRVVRVGEAADGHDDFCCLRSKLLSRYVVHAIRRCSRGGGKLKRLPDGQLGEMLVDLRTGCQLWDSVSFDS